MHMALVITLSQHQQQNLTKMGSNYVAAEISVHVYITPLAQKES